MITGLAYLQRWHFDAEFEMSWLRLKGTPMKTKRTLQKQLAKLTYDPKWVNCPQVVKKVTETRRALEKLSGTSRELKQYELMDAEGNIEGSYTVVELAAMTGMKAKVIRNAISDKRVLTSKYGKYEGYRIVKPRS